MADKIISALATTGTPALTDLIPVAQGSSDATKTSMSAYASIIIAAISNTATGLTYNTATGVLSLTSGYTIPTTASLATYIKQNGNAYGTAMAIGTTDLQPLELITNDTVALIVSITGGLQLPLINSSGITKMMVIANDGTVGIQTIPVASGLQSLNGLTGSTQTFANGVTGGSPNFVSTGTTHTLNIPIAGTAAVGLVNTSSQSFAGNKTFINTVTAISMNINGTSGNGWILFVAQSANAPTPGSGITLYSDASSRLAWNSIAGFITTLDSLSISASRTYTLPDVSMTFVGSGGSNNISSIAFFSGSNTVTTNSGLAWTAPILNLGTIGGTLGIRTGANSKIGTATLTAGTVTIANTSVTANSNIHVTITALGTVAAPKPMVVTRVNATSFTITSSDNTDTSTLNWIIFESLP